MVRKKEPLGSFFRAMGIQKDTMFCNPRVGESIRNFWTMVEFVKNLGWK